MRELHELVGKTIIEAQWSGSNFEGKDDRCLQLRFSDGSMFAFTVLTTCSGDAEMWDDYKNDQPPRKLADL